MVRYCRLNVQSFVRFRTEAASASKFRGIGRCSLIALAGLVLLRRSFHTRRPKFGRTEKVSYSIHRRSRRVVKLVEARRG
jgi:hypothetical protein